MRNPFSSVGDKSPDALTIMAQDLSDDTDATLGSTEKQATEQDSAVLSSPSPTPEVPYSIFSRKEKWFIVAMVAVAGLYSPLPANIYFPAIPQMAEAFHKSTDALNQTVTAYLVMQGISPMLWGPLSDRYGRRPVFLACLVVLIGSCVGLALCPLDAFWLLIVLRCLQAAGCASTIALGAGVIGDISTPEERGGYFGMFNLGPMIAPCIGPAVGGAIAENLGWRSIFWALVIMAALCFVFILCFLPETLRNLAGNGSVSLGGVYRHLIPVVGRKIEASPPNLQIRRRPSINPFVIFTYPDVVISLSFTGIVYAVNYTITATISSSFADIYPWLSETAIGLCYLPTGFGMIAGSTLTGKLLDREYARAKRRMGVEVIDITFPKEYARLRTMPLHLVVFVCCVVAWGFCIQHKAPLAVPLVLQVILGYTSISILNTTMTLMIDVLQTRSSSATACTNLVRCLLAAVLVSVINRMTTRLHPSWSYVLLGGICALLLPLMYVEMKLGPRWRIKRDSKALEI
ncbi:Major facilitator superfamily transporter multidrug resistance [Pleurostoma richardsiae]|uniref:Major facilitator superfamily transporter multidrug resistance n=1 Tax=Pleurostoma richardsiae TaxID=41990 RepID=A0AA38R703_9PEZI|nr:Major facilitator superfamily transporter multidrug resistance [Pleurostoma richardsiae]